ncbi:MAG: hypothetical protein JST84_19775 [Acidobacteria bacterium]|nr:hypothetical protein [Acidobacteriota bacterium]
MWLSNSAGNQISAGDRYQFCRPLFHIQRINLQEIESSHMHIRQLPYTFLFVFFLSIWSDAALQAQQLGGYSEASVENQDIVKAAKIAVAVESKKSRKRLTLLSVLHAQSQVVAGVNYKICLRVKVRGRTKTSEAIVYRNLQQAYSLTSWEWKACPSKS